MHYATPVILAAALTAAVAPAQTRAPSGGPVPPSRFVSGPMSDATTVLLESAVYRPSLQLSSAVIDPSAIVLAQAAATAPAPAQARQPATAARPARATPASGKAPASNALQPCTSVIVDPPTSLTLGKSQVVRLPFPVSRLIMGGQPGGRAGSAAPPAMHGAGTPAAAVAPGTAPAGNETDGVAETDVTLLSPTELFFLGRRPGSMNVVLQANDGRCIVKDIVVTIDPGTLQAKLAELMPEETGIQVRGAANSIVLTGSITDSVKLDHVLSLAGSYGDSKKLVNLMRITAPQQVMLEVKIAEVSKTLLDRFGLDFSRMLRSGDKFSVFTGIFGGRAGGTGSIRPRPNAQGEFDVPPSFPLADLINSANTARSLGINAEKQDGIIRVLAEPNIMAISGQAASFLSGGKIFIPVAQSAAMGGGTTITLEEKEFGVGLKFTPTVLDGRINLKVVSEVSELSQTGTPFTTVAGITAVLPSLSTRKVDTTVQLADGQSFVVAGLIKNNVTEALNKFPGLGETPVVGALFRSTEFQNDRTELMFVVTPRLVKPVTTPIVLPTDNHVVPSRSDVILNGSGEGPDSVPAPANQQPALPAPAGATTAPVRP